MKSKNIFKEKLIILETAHLSKTAVAGGDLLMQGVASFLKKHYQLHVVIPSLALHHWKNKKDIIFHALPSIFLESNKNLISVFLTYCWRIIHTIAILRLIKGPYVLYSSTNIFVDSIPAFIATLIRKDIVWIAMVHHLVQSPLKRQGNFVINAVSFIFDQMSLSSMKSASLIFTLNKSLRDQLMQKDYPKQKLFVLGGGIDFHFIRKVIPNKDIHSYDALFVGRMHRTKGILDLPEIWKRVCNVIPSARLGIIGEISDQRVYKQLKNILTKFEITENVNILGFLPEKILIATMKKSKMLLFTDHEAGFGLVIAEAMASGIPVVGYDNGILGVVYKKGFRKAYLGDYNLFSKAVIELLQNEHARHKLSQDAKKEAVKHDWKYVSKRFYSSIRQLDLRQ